MNEIARYIRLEFVLPAAAMTAGVILLVVVILYGKRFLKWLRRGVLKRDEDELESIETLIEKSRRPVSAIPLIAESVSRMAGEGKFNVVHLLTYLMAQSTNLGASDLHFTPTDEGLLIMTRIEGTLYDIARLPKTALEPLLRRIKVMAELDMYTRDVPQDGRISVRSSQSIDIRVSIMPTIHGPKCVLRFFTTPVHLLSLVNLGFGEKTLGAYTEQILKPQGMLFMTGPTGSGKTITAYATLNTIKEAKRGKVNLVSIEDPVEFNLPFINQTQVNEKTGLTFSVGLRSLLRQDPNVILIGEIRDRETMEIAMQAGLTGHLILSSVHADSTAGVFTRLINMGVEPFVLASATSGVLAQRLVRKLCPHCRKETETTVPQLVRLQELGVELAEDDRTFMTADGCEKCLGMGFIGRTGIFEFLTVDPVIHEAIVAKESAQKIYARCIQSGMKPLIHEGLDRAREGMVSLEEVLAVV
jgi:general secretion pathway protein E